MRVRTLLGALGLVAALVALAALFWTGGLPAGLRDLAGADAEALDRASAWVAGLGVLAPAGYLLAVIVEVVIAPIPSPILYAAGGAVFGGFRAGMLTLAGNAVGAYVAARVGAWLGEKWVQSRFGDRLGSMVADGRRGFWVVLLLRLNPLTSTDVASYAAGAIGLKPGAVTLATTLGVLPLVFVQTYAGPAVLEAMPATGLVLLLGGVVYAVVLVATIFRR